MPDDIRPDRIREWIDDDLVEEVERLPDEAAEYNFAVQLSGMIIHVIKQRPGGPLLLGQQIEFDDAIRTRIREMPDPRRNALVARIREALMQIPVVYGFQDERDANVAFEEMHHIFIEHRIYPDEATQGALMGGLIAVWKGLRYLDDIWSLMDSIEAER